MSSNALPPALNPFPIPRSGGTKRARSDADDDAPPSFRMRLNKASPEQIMQGWASKLPINLSEHPKAQTWLETLAKGVAPDDAQEVFSLLIREQAFHVFVEVYQAYNELRMAEQELDPAATPFETFLELDLPADWAPASEQDMLDAFVKLHVQNLKVVCQSVRVRRARTTLLPIPDAVSLCIRTLLQNGTASLDLKGPFKTPQIVAEAIQDSRLQSVSLMRRASDSALSDETRESYQTLMTSGLVHCKTLKHISFGHLELLAQLPVASQFSRPEGPALASVAFSLPMFARDDDPSIPLFMQRLNTFPNLSIVSAGVCVCHAAELESVVLAPLKGHPSLTKLSVIGPIGFTMNEDDLTTFFRIFDFAASCPKLTDFEWDQGTPLSIDWRALDTFHTEGVDFNMAEQCAIMENQLEAPNFPLRRLSVSGRFLPPGPLNALARALKNNKSLLELNLANNIVNWESLTVLDTALRSNGTACTFTLPPKKASLAEGDQGYYYMQSPDGRLYKLGKNESTDGLALNFEWEGDEGQGPTQEARDLAQATFITLSPAVDKAFEEIPVKLSQNRHRVHAELHNQVLGGLQHVMATALASAPVDSVSLDPGTFSIPAQTILGILAQEQYLNTAVHLSGVSAQRTEAGSLAPRPKISAALQDLIQQDEAFTSSRPPQPSLDSVANETNADGANVQLLKAVLARDAALVATWIARGATDPSGLARAAANGSARLIAALDYRPPVERRVTTTNTTNTTTTTSAATTMGATTAAPEFISTMDIDHENGPDPS